MRRIIGVADEASESQTERLVRSFLRRKGDKALMLPVSKVRRAASDALVVRQPAPAAAGTVWQAGTHATHRLLPGGESR